MMSVQDVLNRNGTRKLLALDGGGIRGILAIEVLSKIESILQEKLRRDDSFVLADYFDYIAGTSTGAILATCLSWGMRVSEMRAFYLTSGEKMFDKASFRQRLKHKYEDAALAQQLQTVFGEATLGSDRLQTLLMIMMRNASTNSPWPLSNNPRARYNDPTRPDCNLNLPLWQLVRASTAAPTFFPPEVVKLGDDQEFVFVDGGITPYNNPAFQLFLMATLKAYKLQWMTGEHQMLVVSIGTGFNNAANRNLQPDEMNLLYNAQSVPSALMDASATEQDLLCRVFGRCLVGDALDREINDLITEPGPAPTKLFTYLRYNHDLSRLGLDQLGLPDIQPEAVMKMDQVKHIHDMQRVGCAIADQKVKPEHFQKFLAV